MSAASCRFGLLPVREANGEVARRAFAPWRRGRGPWHPSTTLRVVPLPIASQQGGDKADRQRRINRVPSPIGRRWPERAG